MAVGQRQPKLNMPLVRAGLGLIAIILSILLAVALTLRFFIQHLIFLDAENPPTGWDERIVVDTPSKDLVTLYRYGYGTGGCVVFFPGQHGLLPHYEDEIFAPFKERSVSVFAIKYVAGARSRPLADTAEAAAQAVRVTAQRCHSQKVLVVGRSLGAMIAAYSAVKAQAQISGLLLEGVSPSLSAAIHAKLSAYWMLKPLNCVPIHSLLPYDYSLNDALQKLQDIPVVIFQGSKDELAPAAVLQQDKDLVGHAKLHTVEGGRHSDTYRLAGAAYWHSAMALLAR